MKGKRPEQVVICVNLWMTSHLDHAYDKLIILTFQLAGKSLIVKAGQEQISFLITAANDVYLKLITAGWE